MTTTKSIKRKRKRSVTLGKIRKIRQDKRCDNMFRHGKSGRCIEFDGRLARKLYPKKTDRMNALKNRRCYGILHKTRSRYRCIDTYARRQRVKRGTNTRRKSRSRSKSKSKSKDTKDLDTLVRMLSKL